MSDLQRRPPLYRNDDPYAVYQEEHKPNYIIAILLFLFLGFLSTIGYLIYAKDPDNASKQIVAVILVVISVIANIIVFTM